MTAKLTSQPLIVYLPDQRDVIVGRFGSGNVKLGFGVFTYSRLAGKDHSCPGSTSECEAICYAKRIHGAARDVHARNTNLDHVPEIPAACSVIRIHVSGDFDTPDYIMNWITRLRERPDVTCWAYTRSWRCHSLLEYLEVLRALPNMQLFASMDPSTDDLPPEGWRRAWIWRDAPNGEWPTEARLMNWTKYDDKKILVTMRHGNHNMLAWDGASAYVCPEETGRKADCLSCGYCFEGQKHDVVFLEHGGPK